MLAGHVLRVAAFHVPPYTMINNSAPPGAGWGRRFSGFEVELVLSMAERGGFQVLYDEAEVFAGETWSDALVRIKDSYDLIAGGGWIETSERRHRGVVFTTSFADFGIVLVIAKPRVISPGFWVNAWYWLRPFTWDAYPVILMCFIVPSVSVWLLEKRRQPGLPGCMESLYMGWLGAVGFGDHTWVKNWFSRAVNVSWTLLILVLLSSYTASLTTFLVQSSQGQTVAQDVDEFLQRGRKACIPKGWAVEQLVLTKYSTRTNQFHAINDTELTMKVAQGVCDGFLMPLDYARLMINGGPPRTDPENSDELDYGCGLQIIGRTVIPGLGGFPMGSGNCRWYIAQVLSGLLRGAAERQEVEGFFSDAMNRLTTHHDGRPRCSGGSAEEVEQVDAVRITAPHLTGLLITVFLPILAASAAGYIVNKVCKARGQPNWAVDLRTLDDESIGLLTDIRQRQMEMLAKIDSFTLAAAQPKTSVPCNEPYQMESMADHLDQLGATTHLPLSRSPSERDQVIIQNEQSREHYKGRRASRHDNPSGALLEGSPPDITSCDTCDVIDQAAPMAAESDWAGRDGQQRRRPSSNGV